MLASFDDRLCLELLLNPIKLLLIYNGCVKAFIDIPFVSDLSYIDGIDQNVVYRLPVRSCQTNQLEHHRPGEREFYEAIREHHSLRATSRFSLKSVRLSQRSTADRHTAPMALPGKSGAAVSGSVLPSQTRPFRRMRLPGARMTPCFPSPMAK